MAEEERECKPKRPLLTTIEKVFSFPGRPTAIRAPHGANIFEISWPNGAAHRIPNEILRGFCPCAGCQGHSGEIKFQADNNQELRDISTVGNYALSLTWGDSHSTGIYTFEFLYRLGEMHDQLGSPGLIELSTLPRTKIL